MSINKELSAIFDRWAAVLELLDDNRFKINAYKRAARLIGDLTVDLATLTDDIKKLIALEGIGKGLAEKIIEYHATGAIAEFVENLKPVPPGVLAMMDIPGLGPKGVATLWKQGGVDSVELLKQKIDEGGLEDLPRMGKKSLEKIRKAIEFAETSSGRVRIGQAMNVAETFVETMRRVKQVKRAEFAGSLRRGRDTIGDVDILVACDDPEAHGEAIGQAFREHPAVTDVIAAGPTKSSVRTEQGLQVDLRVVNTDGFGAALLYFTGSKQHNVRLRERAIKLKLTLNLRHRGGHLPGAQPRLDPPYDARRPRRARTRRKRRPAQAGAAQGHQGRAARAHHRVRWQVVDP
ncbi:MAG: helix-hairpin-helix domain-containing protein [Planctomycetota bacterium]|jgi:DNA polymerase (family 10)